jgi:hypothetical protein
MIKRKRNEKREEFNEPKHKLDVGEKTFREL